MDVVKRPMEDILGELLPAKSGKAYSSAWKAFVEFLGHNNEPSEMDYIQYFDFLKATKDYKASSFWVMYSKLNSMHQRTFGTRLQAFPRLKILLKSYEQGYVRRVAKVFSLQEIQSFMRMPLDGPYWTLRKAFIAISYCGGLRAEEAYNLKFGSLTHTNDGYYVVFHHAKQVGEQKSSEYLVPYDEDKQICFATKVKLYLDALDHLRSIGNDEPLFFGCSGGKGFVNQRFGKRYMQEIGKQVAKLLNLEDDERYTWHCWRRSAATEAAGSGATSSDLKRQFGWRQESTAMRYLESTKQQAVKMSKLLRNGAAENHAPKADGASSRKADISNQNVQYVYNIQMADHCTINLK